MELHVVQSTARKHREHPERLGAKTEWISRERGQALGLDPWLILDSRIAQGIVRAHRLARFHYLADLESAGRDAAVRPVYAFRKTCACHQMQTVRSIRTNGRPDALGAQVAGAKEPDPRERCIEIFDQTAGDFREHFTEVAGARHPQTHQSEGPLER